MTSWRNRLVANKLRQGAVIAYPTEGVWGLGCIPELEQAVSQLLELKQRPWQKGLILVASSLEQIMPYVVTLSEQQHQTLQTTWPGPVTYLIPASEKTPIWVRGEHATVAVRVSSHPVVRGICEELGGPIISTSANPASKPPALTRLRLKQYFGDNLDYVVPGALGGASGPSEIRDLINNTVIRGAAL